MHPARQALEILENPEDAANADKREMALVYALLAIADSLENLGTDVREATRGVDTELGAISIALGQLGESKF